MTKSHKVIRWLRGVRPSIFIVAFAMYADYFIYGLSEARWHRLYLVFGFVCCLFGGLVGLLRPRIQLDHQLIGVRAFRLRSGGVLSAITGRNDWTPGVNEAQCIQDVLRNSRGQIVSTQYNHYHEVPQGDCHCGFNVHFSLADLHESDFQYDCTAVVEGWGRSRLHGNGWRSQYARILAIVDEEGPYVEDPSLFVADAPKRFVPVRDRILLQAAAMRYNVPIITAQQAAQGLDEFGTAVPENIKAWVTK